MTIRVIELFSGIGAQAEALKELGLDYEVVATSDIDKHANLGYEAIHGKVNNLGDVTKIEHLPECDLLTYSYPCTSISLAGKREGMKEGSGTASSLLWEVGRLLKDMREREVAYRKYCLWRTSMPFSIVSIDPNLTVGAES